MPSIFAITPDDEKVKVQLSPEGRGEFAFTVTNTSGKPITARAKVTSKDPSQQSWLKIQDDPQRTYPGIKGVEKFTVQIVAPPNAAPGTYSFHLNVSAIENPDELFTIGPAVSFEVPQPVNKQPLNPWPILAVVVAVLVVGLALWYFLSKKPVSNLVTVPDVTGMDIAKAQEALIAANLTLGASTNNQTATGDPNTVVSQTPLGKVQVASGTAVALVVKADTIPVPHVVGSTIAQAISTITQNHLVANPVAVQGNGTSMTVSSQSPDAPLSVALQSTVTLNYVTTPSSPPLAVSIPAQQYKALPATTKANIVQQAGPNKVKVLPK